MAERPRVLIVDDDISARDTFEALLLSEGYDLIFASSGAQALEKASRSVPDLVLLDVMMPVMDGFEVCLRLRESPLLAVVPVIMVTSLDDRASRLRGIEAGADDFISKPVDGVELRARVKTVVRLNRYRRLLEETTRRQQAEDEVHRLYQELQHYVEDLEQTVEQRTRELQAERDRTHSILQALGEAVVVADLDGTIQYANPAAIVLTGYGREEIVGQRVSLWQSDNHSADQYVRMWSSIRAGEQWHGEIVGRRRDGTLYDALLTVAPLHEPGCSGQLVGFVGIQRDVTQLKEAQRVKDQFVSNVSHELRTPLSVLLLASGNLDTLYDRLTEERRRRIIRDVWEQCQVLSELIHDVLEVSRIDAGHIPTERQAVCLDELLRLEVEEQLTLARRKSQTLKLVSPGSLSIWGHAGQLRQVIRNLINNAIKYTPEGGEIICECRQLENGLQESTRWPGSASLSEGRWAALRVTDTGVGIGPEHLSHLFERFYRVAPQGNIPGTGLGLSIAKELIELHGGYVGVSSTLGLGSVFAFYLPLPDEE